MSQEESIVDTKTTNITSETNYETNNEVSLEYEKRLQDLEKESAQLKKENLLREKETALKEERLKKIQLEEKEKELERQLQEQEKNRVIQTHSSLDSKQPSEVQKPKFVPFDTTKPLGYM